MKKHSELEKNGCTNSTCDLSQASNLDTFHTYSAISTVSFIVGGAGLVAGTILLLTEPKESTPPTGARISPFIALGGAGVKGTF
jgi:hypothetical protein